MHFSFVCLLLIQLVEREHIAPVLCITSSLLVGEVVISGGEDSIINVVQWLDGERMARIDHHRGPVTCLAINNRQDVLVSGMSSSTLYVTFDVFEL